MRKRIRPLREEPYLAYVRSRRLTMHVLGFTGNGISTSNLVVSDCDFIDLRVVSLL